MKRISLFIIAMLVASLGLQAKSIKKYLRLSDANLNSGYWQDHTINPGTGMVECTAQGNNSSIAWTFTNDGIDISEYSKIVLEITEPQEADMYIKLNDTSDNFWNFDNKAEKKFTNVTKVEITLSNLTKSNNSAVNLKTIKAIEIHHSSVGGSCYYIKSFYLEKEVDDDYKDWTAEPFNVSEIKTADVEFTDSWTWTPGGWPNWIGWEYSTDQDWSAYKYLVIVSQKEWTEADGAPGMIYNIKDNNQNEAITWWFHQWGSHIINVQDLTDLKQADGTTVSEVSVSNINQIHLLIGNGGSNENKYTYGLSAIYLTNTKPNESGDYTRDYSVAGQYGTICLPYAAAVSGADLYEVKGVDSKENPTKLYIEEAHGVMTAGKAYIFKSNSTSKVTFYRVSEDEAENAITDSGLIGTLTGTAVPEGAYIYVGGEDNAWKKVTSSNAKNINANKAYLDLTNLATISNTEAQATPRLRSIAIKSDGTTTNINTIEKANSDNYATFTLSGMPTSKNTKGIIISKNKKYIVK